MKIHPTFTTWLFGLCALSLTTVASPAAANEWQCTTNDAGDVNGDATVDVIDIVSTVTMVLNDDVLWKDAADARQYTAVPWQVTIPSGRMR